MRRLFSTTRQLKKAIEIDSKNFKKEVLESKIPVILDCYAVWCKPCQGIFHKKLILVLAPVLEKKVEESGKVKLVKLNVDDFADELMENFPEKEVNSIPTVWGIKDGKIVSEFVGMLPEKEVSCKYLNF